MNAGQRTWLRWSQVRNPRRINRTAPMVKSPPHHPQPSPRASRPSFRGRDGRRSRKPGARACRCGQSNGSWASTGPPSGVIWRPEVLQDGSSGWCPIRRHRIPWQRNGVTFSLNTYPDIYPEQRHSTGAQYAGSSSLINIKRDDALLHLLAGHYHGVRCLRSGIRNARTDRQ